MAFQLAQNWIRTNYDVYSRTSAMYEKVSLGLSVGTVAALGGHAPVLQGSAAPKGSHSLLPPDGLLSLRVALSNVALVLSITS